MDELKVRQIFREEIERRFGSGAIILQEHMQLFDGRNIQTGRTTGTKIATATDQKLGFFGAVPVPQQAEPTDLSETIALLQAYGLSA
jgi:hypothetical protein